MNAVTICNMALMKVGIPPITSFDDENNNAKICKTFFPVLRDRVLRDHAWSFATAFLDLQALAESSPDPELPIVCALPGDAIRVLSIDGGRPYRRMGVRMLVPELPATVIYIRRILDPELFDETFAEALQYLLASEIGLAGTRDPQLVDRLRQEYERRLAVARAIDSQENRHAAQPQPRRSHWIDARGGTGCRRAAGGVRWVEGTEGKQG